VGFRPVRFWNDLDGCQWFISVVFVVAQKAPTSTEVL